MEISANYRDEFESIRSRASKYLDNQGQRRIDIHGTGRWNDAEELLVQVMETRQRVLGQEHPDTSTSVGTLAFTYISQGLRKDAEELLGQAMETEQRELSLEHPDTLNSIDKLASTDRHELWARDGG